MRECREGKRNQENLLKDWILFFGELVKASVDGVVEFWKPEDSKPVAEEPIVAEYEESDEEYMPEIESQTVEVPTPDVSEASACSAKELKKQAKMIKRAAKRVRKEEKQIKRKLKADEKRLKQLEKEEQREKEELEKQEKVSKKVQYVSKNRILTGTEKKFYDGIKSAVGLRYVVKPRVALADVIRREDGSKCHDDELGEMDFGVFDLQNRLKVFIEIRGMRRRGKQRRKTYKKVRKICKKVGIPVVTFWAKYGVLNDYIKERMQDHLNVL